MTEITESFKLPKIFAFKNVTTSWFSQTGFRPPRSLSSSTSSARFDEVKATIISVSKRCEHSRRFAGILPPINPVMTLTCARLDSDYPILYSNARLQDIYNSHWNIKKPKLAPSTEIHREVTFHLKKEFNKKKKRYRKEKPLDEEKLLELKLHRNSLKEKAKGVPNVSTPKETRSATAHVEH